MKPTNFDAQGERQESVLIAEDDPAVRRILSSVMTFEGLDVVGVEDGDDALIAIRSGHPFAGVFLDLSLPGPPSEELIRRIREETDVPIFIITGSPDPDRILGEAKSEVREIFIKPFNPLDLIEALHST